MAKDCKAALHESVTRFREWAKKTYPHITEYNDNGQLWPSTDEYQDMMVCILNVLKNTSPEDADDITVDDILYGIARDDECSVIMDDLEGLPQWFSLLCRKSVDTGYINAQWQFAYSIGEYEGDDDLTDVLERFISCGHEYTERMALRSMAKVCPEKAEEYAVKFFERDIYDADEYQKMMALEVLYETGSDRLMHYLGIAERSSYEHLKSSAAEIRRKLTE